MKKINPLLKDYIEKNILPEYKKNESGHGIEHIQYVTKRCFKFAEQFPNIDLDMIYTIASFHDIAHHIDKDNHETLSAKYFYDDKNMKKFFDSKQRKVIKEAIDDLKERKKAIDNEAAGILSTFKVVSPKLETDKLYSEL